MTLPLLIGLFAILLYLAILEQVARRSKYTFQLWLILAVIPGGLAAGACVDFALFVEAAKKAPNQPVRFADTFAWIGGLGIGIFMLAIVLWRYRLGSMPDYFADYHSREEKPGLFWFYLMAFLSTAMGCLLSALVFSLIL